MLSGKQIFWLILVFLVAAAAWMAWAIYGIKIVSHLTGYTALDQAGQWGDTFGGLNAIIGAAGTCLVLATLLAQRQSLREQQIDLHKQRFETTFFKLLELMREIKGEALTRANESSIFRITANRIAGLDFSSLPEEEIRGRLVDYYHEQVYDIFERQLSPYFRIVYTMLRRIKDDLILSEEDKIGYGNLLRSQLTSDEVALAGYNGLTSVSKDFSALLIEFRILKYLPVGFHREMLSRFYPVTAFQARQD